MATPIIYSNKKHVGSGEELVLTKGPWDGVVEDVFTTTSLGYTGTTSTFQPDITSISFDPFGTRMYGIDATTDSVFQYDLPLGNWDLSSIVEVTEYNIYPAYSSYPEINFGSVYGVQLKPDGSKMFTLDVQSNFGLMEHNIESVWDLTTASYDGVWKGWGGNGVILASFQFIQDGSAVVGPALSAGSDVIYLMKYELSGSWDITTMSDLPTETVDMNTYLDPGKYMEALKLSPDGKKAYVLQSNGVLREHDLGTAYNLTSIGPTVVTSNLTAQGTLQTWVEYDANFTKIFIVDAIAGAVDIYDTNYVQNLNNVWYFPDSTLGVDYSITQGTLYSDVITIKILRSMEEFTIEQITTGNKVLNGSSWEDTSGAAGVGNNWNAPTTSQTNTIETGWNFAGKSQRVTQGTGRAYIYQTDLIEDLDEHNLTLKYRANAPMSIKAGGLTFNLPKTEVSEEAIYPIQHSAGIINFLGEDGGGNEWVFSDGSTASTASISKNLPAGTSYLIMNNFTGSAITSLGTGSIYTGDLQDIPKNVAIIELEDTNVSGPISELNHILETVYISNNTGIYGDVAVLGNLTDTLDLGGCPNISGDISSLTSPQTIILSGCNVEGALLSGANYTHINLSNTNLTFDDIVDTIIHASARADDENINDGYFECYDNMPTISGDGVGGACDAYFNLISRDWVVKVKAFCSGSWFGL